MSRRDKTNLFAKMSFPDRRRLEQMYLDGEKVEVLTVIFNKSRADIQKYLSNVGVPRRPVGNFSHRRRHEISKAANSQTNADRLSPENNDADS